MGSAVLTVVFVDVEASTALLAGVGDQAGADAIQRQLGAIRERVEPYGGREVKTLGDGLLLAFESPRGAVSFALAAQRAVGASMPRVKIGINTGEVLDAHADPIGGAVNAAARIAARARGGEVLVSEVVRQLAGAVPTVQFLDRGRVRLKGFDERWHLYAAADISEAANADPIVGRSAELDVVDGLLETIASGSGSTVLVEGEAGIGKTHVVAAALVRARARSFAVLATGADELDAGPGAIVRRLVDETRVDVPGRSRLVELLAAPVEGVDLGFAMVEATVELVEAAAATGPVVVVVEDLHWADELSLRCVAALLRRTQTLPVGFLLTARLAPRPSLLDRVVETVHAAGGHSVVLQPLDEVAVCALAGAQIGAAPGDGLRRRLEGAGGNPLFIIELLRALDESGALRATSGVVEVGDGELPSTLRQTVVRRLSWLATETVEMLRLASVLGGTFTLGDVAVVTGRRVVEVAAALHEAAQAALIVGDGDRLAFRHDLLREAIYESIPPAVRHDLHRAAGQALAAAGSPSIQVAQQLLLGGRVGDEDAIEWLERAARDAMAYSPATSIELLERALGLAPVGWPGRDRIEAAMIEPLAACGRHADGEAAARRVLAASPSPDIAHLALRGLAAVQGLRGDFATCIATLNEAAASPAASTGDRLLDRCLAAEMSIITGSGDRGACVDEVRRILREAEDAHDEQLRCLALQTIGIAETQDGYGDLAVGTLRDAAEIVASGRVAWRSFLAPQEFHVMALVEADRIDEALDVASAALSRGERVGATSVMPLAALGVGGAHFFAGRWDDAIAALEALVALADDVDNRGFLLYAHAMLAHVALHRGDVAVERWSRAADEHLAAAHSPAGIDWVLAVRAEARALAGDAAGALAIAHAGWQLTSSVRYGLGHRRHAVQLVRLAVANGADDLAVEVAEAMEEGARRSTVPSAAATARHCRGLVERDVDLVVDAAARMKATPLPLQTMLACEDAAAALAGEGRGDDAVKLWDDAGTIAAQLGATVDATRIDGQLRAAGVRRRPRAKRPSTGWASLTNAELEVAVLVAQGLTNPAIGERLFVSRRTVETHLSHIFSKCGFTSRAQLAAEVTRRGD